VIAIMIASSRQLRRTCWHSPVSSVLLNTSPVVV